jgi:fucose 4-O-acetylase-like acetyltransferase
MKKLLIGGVIAGIVMIITGMIFGALSAEMYKMSPKILWKTMDGNWFTQIVIYDLISALILAYVFSMVKGSIPGAGLQKGVFFGLIVFAVGPLLGLSMTYLTMAVRTKLIAVWALNSLVDYILAGLIFGIIDEKIT